MTEAKDCQRCGDALLIHESSGPYKGAQWCASCSTPATEGEILRSRTRELRKAKAELATLRAQLAGVRPLVTLARQIWRDDTSEPETIGMQLIRDLAALGDAPESPRTQTNARMSADGDTP